MDATSLAASLQNELQSAGAGSGAVACRIGGSGPAVSAWGEVCRTSVFETGSVTKAMTGLLLALAIDAGAVASSDRLDRYLPRTGAAGSATLAELATHSSGLPRLGAAALVRALAHPRNPYQCVPLHSLIRDARLVPRRRRGESAYSNLGVALLGQALAAAAGLPYWELARTSVLGPLGMTSSGDLPRSALAAPDTAWDLGAYAPAGGLRATVDDLLRLAWVAARPEESPFPSAAADALTPRAAMANGHVGWCWMLTSQGRHRVAWHNGATGASWAFIGATGSCAIAACLLAQRQAAFDAAAMHALAAAGEG